MYPFSFDEFLIASGKEIWVKAYQEASPQNPVFEALRLRILLDTIR
jgi:hypothetical protein